MLIDINRQTLRLYFYWTNEDTLIVPNTKMMKYDETLPSDMAMCAN